MAELLYRQSHATAQANLLRKSIPHDFAEILLMDNPQQKKYGFHPLHHREKLNPQNETEEK